MSYRLTLRLPAVEAALDSAAERGMTKAMEYALTEANKHVPHDEGTLERSSQTGVASDSGGVSGSVSYDTPYAVRQHEDMSLHHDGKGEAKWLENTLAEESATLGQIVAAEQRTVTR